MEILGTAPDLLDDRFCIPFKVGLKGHDTYTNSTVESGLVCVCVMLSDWIVGPFPRLIRRVGNHEMFKMND